MKKNQAYTNLINKKSYAILFFILFVFTVFIIFIFISKLSKDNATKQDINNNYQYQVDYKYGVMYVDSVYGVKIEFPEGVNSYKYKEYKWPSHKHVYNPIFEKTFATASNKFNFETGNFYLSNDNPQTLGDLITYSVYDIKNCDDANFCQKYVYNEKKSGVVVNGYEPYTFWMRNDNYLIMFGVLNEKITSENSRYKLSVE